MSTGTLEEIVKNSIEGLGFLYYGLQTVRSGSEFTVCVYVEGNESHGVSLDDCRDISVNLKPLLNVEANLPDDYILEVSSPGMDRLLFRFEHYQAQIGNEITVKLKKKINDRKNFKGILNSVDEKGIVLTVDGEGYELSIADIEQARLVPSW